MNKQYLAPKIVASHDLVPSWLRIVLLLLVIGGVGWYGFQLGGEGLKNGFIGFDPSSKDKIQSLEEDRDNLRRQLAMAEQSTLMDQEAIKAIKGEVKRIQDERLKMEEELAFLRGIVSTDSNKKGLRIQKFKLEPGSEKRQFTYQFTVSQLINSGLVAKGSINIRVEGLRDGKNQVFNLDALTPNKQKNLKMRFKFFQNVEGNLLLPSDFAPSVLKIEVKPTSNKFAPVSETYDWAPIS